MLIVFGSVVGSDEDESTLFELWMLVLTVWSCLSLEVWMLALAAIPIASVHKVSNSVSFLIIVFIFRRNQLIAVILFYSNQLERVVSLAAPDAAGMLWAGAKHQPIREMATKNKSAKDSGTFTAAIFNAKRRSIVGNKNSSLLYVQITRQAIKSHWRLLTSNPPVYCPGGFALHYWFNPQMKSMTDRSVLIT